MRALVPSYGPYKIQGLQMFCRDKARIGTDCQKSLFQRTENCTRGCVETGFGAKIHTARLGGDLGHGDCSPPGFLHQSWRIEGRPQTSEVRAGSEPTAQETSRAEPWRPHPFTWGGAGARTRSFHAGSRTARMRAGPPRSA